MCQGLGGDRAQEQRTLALDEVARHLPDFKKAKGFRSAAAMSGDDVQALVCRQLCRPAVGSFVARSPFFTAKKQRQRCRL